MLLLCKLVLLDSWQWKQGLFLSLLLLLGPSSSYWVGSSSLQPDGPCLVTIHGRPALHGIEMEEEWGRGEEGLEGR